jgi:hypothetical protein
VQFPSDVLSDDLAQSTLVRGVDVFVVGLDFERVGRPLLSNLCEALLDGSKLVVGKDACGTKSAYAQVGGGYYK